MQKNKLKLPLFILSGVFYSATASADIFSELADRADIIGGGLTSVGFVIAALGLIFFTFMAIFNKISWKTLAYIMFSCFILGAMTMVINYARGGGFDAASKKLNFDGTGTASDKGTQPTTQDPTTNPTKK